MTAERHEGAGPGFVQGLLQSGGSDAGILIKPFDSSVDRSAFACGEEELDTWLRAQAGQPERRGNTRTFLVGFLPAEIVEKLHAQPLDESLSRVSLRGYQSFGARFALVQRRVIIGDEIGLGKTIQATAALAHIKATGATGMLLVVCPASVVVNWTREVAQRSTLRVHRLHGADREWALKRWARVGDVAVTTFDTLRALDLRGMKFAKVVVDEAHFLKSPATQRAQNLLALLTRAERALFLTGTPMENRVEEFRRWSAS